MQSTSTSSSPSDRLASLAPSSNHTGAPVTLDESKHDSKGAGSADVQSVLSMPQGESSRSPSFGDRISGFGKRLSGKIMSNDADVAYGTAIGAGATREEALAAADEARRAQEQRFEDGVAEAVALGKEPRKNTQPRYIIVPAPGGC
ncbi:hypothetical protein JCM10207_001679 [Rhodosporidiobolus poonsookiae]